MNIEDKIKEVATAENAKEYEAEVDKFVYCLLLLDISANHPKADEWVNELEDLFDKLNEVN